VLPQWGNLERGGGGDEDFHEGKFSILRHKNAKGINIKAPTNSSLFTFGT
jgi:hypothetical protein